MSSSLYTRFVAGLLFPLHEKLKKHTTVAVKDAMEASQWWTPQQLEALRIQRLKALLTKAGNTVPYYRDLFRDIDFDPSAVTSLADLTKLPFLSKPVIRAQGDRLKSEQAVGLARFNTGGSSGEPLIFYIGVERVSHDVAAKWRATRWWDVDIGDKEIVVWGSPIELGTQDRIRAIRDRFIRTELLPAFEMSDAKLDQFVERIAQVRPPMLFGYPSAFTHIAKHARKRGRAMDNLGIKVAFVTSERLYDDQRQIISETFNCPVANGYGSRDAGFIAHQCPSGGMHITAEDIIVEIIDNDGKPLPPGQAGEIVVTHLATGDFPFIRYRTGDVATLDPKPCACGRGLPVLKDIQGRTTDFVMAADGTVMHGLALVYIIRDLPGVEYFKVIQHSLTRTEVQLVVNAAFDRGQVPGIITGFKRRLGNEVAVEVNFVSEIAPEKSGKYRYIVSHVA